MRDTVRIYLDDLPLIVPQVVDCHHAARGVLGLPRGVGVTRSYGGDPIAFPEVGWTFTEGERYFTVSGRWLIDHGFKAPGARPDPWAMEPDWWKLMGPGDDE